MSAPPTIRLEDIEWSAIRAQGAGGQNVNKVSCAVHLRFDIRSSSLPEAIRERLLAMNDQRISKDGIIVIKAQTLRSLEGNRLDALRRLNELVASASHQDKIRRPTQPKRSAIARRLDGKSRRGDIKAGRSKIRA